MKKARKTVPKKPPVDGWLEQERRDDRIIAMQAQSILTEEEVKEIIRLHLKAIGALVITDVNIPETQHKIKTLSERITFLSKIIPNPIIKAI